MKSLKKNIVLNGLPIQVVHKKIKNIHFYVTPPDGHVRVSVPLRMSQTSVQLAITQKLNWIENAVKKIQALPKKTELQYNQGEYHFFLGRPLRLQIEHSLKRPQVCIGDNTLTLKINNNTTVSERKALIEQQFRKEMKQLLPKMIDQWENRLGLKVDQWGIKRMKTRWGSCIPAHRRIWLNLHLIHKPLHCIEYVLVHEMVHFWEHTHNAVFKKHMNHALPDWRETEKALNATQTQPNNV